MRTKLWLCAVLAAGVVAPAAAESAGYRKHPGFVDGSEFLALAGKKTGSVEVTLNGPLLQAMLGFDPELKKLAGALQSIHAVVLEMDDEDEDRWARGRDLMLSTEKKLMDRGWARITRIRDEGTDLSVLVLNDEETIGGLVVLVAGEEGELVFANIAGDIDLAAIAELGERLDIPGLDHLGDDE